MMQNSMRHINSLLANSRNWQLVGDVYAYGVSAFVCGGTEKDPKEIPSDD